MKYLGAVLGVFLLVSCSDSESEVTTDIVNNPNSASVAVDVEQAKEELAAISFENELYDFGEITQGEKVNFTYKFTNTGKANLIISSAKGSCGCTVPDWPREPIKPGESGEIKVVFNSDGKSGKQHKKVSVVANTQPSTTVVALTGNIITPNAEETK